MRIVSLLPSSTEILFALGAADDIAGVTFECDYPEAARGKRIVSTSALPQGLTAQQIDAFVTAAIRSGQDLYHLDAGALRELDADLVVTQDLCAVCAVDVSVVDDALAHLGCRAEVLTVDPHTLGEVIDSIVTLGAAVGRVGPANEIVGQLRSRLRIVTEAVAGQRQPRVAVLEWTDPPYAPGHWVPEMVTAAGGVPAIGLAGQRSVRTSWPAVAAGAPELIVAAPCGYGLEQSVHLAQQLVAHQVLPSGVPVWAVDANASFARPGPRLVDGVEALAAILHPGQMAARPALARRVG